MVLPMTLVGCAATFVTYASIGALIRTQHGCSCCLGPVPVAIHDAVGLDAGTAASPKPALGS